jgi:hypothetical protein
MVILPSFSYTKTSYYTTVRQAQDREKILTRFLRSLRFFALFSLAAAVYLDLSASGGERVRIFFKIVLDKPCGDVYNCIKQIEH